MVKPARYFAQPQLYLELRTKTTKLLLTKKKDVELIKDLKWVKDRQKVLFLNMKMVLEMAIRGTSKGPLKANSRNVEMTSKGKFEEPRNDL